MQTLWIQEQSYKKSIGRIKTLLSFCFILPRVGPFPPLFACKSTQIISCRRFRSSLCYIKNYNILSVIVHNGNPTRIYKPSFSRTLFFFYFFHLCFQVLNYYWEVAIAQLFFVIFYFFFPRFQIKPWPLTDQATFKEKCSQLHSV